MATHPAPGSNDCGGAGPVRLGVAAALCAAACAAGPALGEVQLATAVSLVQTFLGEDGQLEQRLADPNGVAPGDELRYTITFTNTGVVPVEEDAIVITNPMPESTEYVPGSAGGEGVRILFSANGEAAFAPFDAPTPNEGGGERPATGAEVRAVRWIYERSLAPGASSEVWFHLRLPPAELGSQWRP